MKWFRTGCYAVAMFFFASAAFISTLKGLDNAGIGFTMVSLFFAIALCFSTGGTIDI